MSDGAVDLGDEDAIGSSGMQCEVVAVRNIWWGREMFMIAVGRTARRSMYGRRWC